MLNQKNRRPIVSNNLRTACLRPTTDGQTNLDSIFTLKDFLAALLMNRIISWLGAATHETYLGLI